MYKEILHEAYLLLQEESNKTKIFILLKVIEYYTLRKKMSNKIDHFINSFGDEVVMYTYNPLHRIDFDYYDLGDLKKLVFSDIYEEQKDNSFEYISDTNYTVDIFIKRRTKEPINPLYNIILPCIFKAESSEYLKAFYEYYRKLGVNKFFMYYTDDITTRTEVLPMYSDVEYIEFNLPLISLNLLFVNKPIKCIKNVNIQHSQFTIFQHPFLQLMKYKYLPLSKYMLSVDCDELFFLPNDQTLTDYLNNVDFTNFKSIYLKSRFTNWDINAKTFYRSNGELSRTKYIYTRDWYNKYYNTPLLLHWGPGIKIEDGVLNELQLFHITESSHPERFDHTKDSNYTIYSTTL